MLPKKNRLRRKREFEEVLRKGTVAKGKFFVLRIKDSKSEFSRFGFVVSTKISKKAVVRNKVKRRARNIVRELLESLRKNIDGVFIALPGVEKASFDEMKSDILSLLNKFSLLENGKKTNN